MAVVSRRNAIAASTSLALRIASATISRAFGAASAAVELDYESEREEDYRFRHRSSPPPAADTEEWGEMQVRGVQWVFMGKPSAQKSVYATRVAQLLEVPYISMGTLVRQELHPHSSLYIQIANAVNEGKLVPEDIIFCLLSKRLEEGYYRGETGFILDGIPRTRIQAEILDEIADIDLVVNFNCAEDCLVKKHFGNDMCAHCGKTSDVLDSYCTDHNSCFATRTSHSKLNTSAAFNMDKSRLERLQMYSEQATLLSPHYLTSNSSGKSSLGFTVVDALQSKPA